MYVWDLVKCEVALVVVRSRCCVLGGKIRGLLTRFSEKARREVTT
jgi:hypothetical protein